MQYTKPFFKQICTFNKYYNHFFFSLLLFSFISLVCEWLHLRVSFPIHRLHCRYSYSYCYGHTRSSSVSALVKAVLTNVQKGTKLKLWHFRQCANVSYILSYLEEVETDVEFMIFVLIFLAVFFFSPPFFPVLMGAYASCLPRVIQQGRC